MARTQPTRATPASRLATPRPRRDRLITITALVDEGGVGGCKLPKRRWRMAWHSRAWRIGDGPVQVGRLRFEEVSTQALVRLSMETIPPLSIVRVRCLPIDESRPGWPLAQVRTRRGVVEDRELAAIAEQRRKPVYRRDPLFGRMRLDRRFDRFAGRAAWLGDRIDIDVAADSPEALDSSLSHARRLWKRQRAWSKRARAVITERLFVLANTVWRPAAKPEMTRRRFWERLTPKSVSVGADGSVHFYFTDDDMFWGHWIEVRGSVDTVEVAGLIG